MKLLDNLIKQTSTYKHLDMPYMSALDELEQAQEDIKAIKELIKRCCNERNNNRRCECGRV